MGLPDIYADYRSGKYSKHQYIDLMHKQHQLLFEYSELLADSDVSSIEITANHIVATTRCNGLRLYLDRFDSRFIPIEIINFKQFDPVERPLIEAIATNSHTIFDIGGNIGWYSLNFSKWAPNAKIHAFEPIPRTFDFFMRHLALNKVENVIPNNCAVGDAEGERDFYWTELETGSASMRNIQDRDKINMVKCRVVTLDDYCSKNEIKRIDFIKCDIEGGELFAFMGAKEILRISQPVVFTEMLRKWSAKFGYHPNNIIDLFSRLGYQCYGYVGGRLTLIHQVDENTLPTNFFFICPGKHASIIERFVCR